MEKKYEINLLVGEKFYKSYDWYEIPIVDDVLAIENGDGSVFIVKKRLLPMSDSNRVVLFGTIEKEITY